MKRSRLRDAPRHGRYWGMGGGSKGGGDTTQTTTQSVQLTPEQKAFLGKAYSEAGGFKGLRVPKYSAVQGFDPTQIEGQNALLDQARGPLKAYASDVMDASKFGLHDVLGPNQFLNSYIQAAQRPLTENFQQNILPSLALRSVQLGGFGGSGQAISEGLAAKELQKQTGDISARLSSEGYQAGLDTYTRSLALAPQVAQMQTMPAALMDAVGQQRQGLAQARLSEKFNRNIQKQVQPLMLAREFSNLAFGLGAPSTTGTSTISQPDQGRGGQVQGAIGAGLAGGAMGSMLAGATGGAVTGPVGAGVGALLGLLASFMG